MEQDIKQEFGKIDQRFETLFSFLYKNMVTKEEFSELSERVNKLEAAVGRLTDTVEKLVTAVNKIADEHTVIKHQMLVMQEWIRKASEKLGIEFKL